MLRTTLISILSALVLAASLAGAASAAPERSAATGPPVQVYVAELFTKIYRGDDGGALYLRQSPTPSTASASTRARTTRTS